MKKIITSIGLLAILLIQINSNAQDVVKPEYSKKVKIEKQGPGHLAISGLFNHNDELCLLTNNVNLKFYYYIYYMHFEPFNTGFSIYRFNKSSKKFLKPEKIEFPLDKVYYNFETYWYKDNILNIYTSHKNKSARKIYYFCTQYNMDTKKSTTTKIYECSLKEKTTLQVSENKEWAMAISCDKRSKNAQVDYIIFDNTLKVKSFGSKIKLDGVAYADIDNFELSNKGNIFIETLYKNKKSKLFEKKTYSNDIYMLKDQDVFEIKPPTYAKYTSYRKLFLDNKGTLKVANFYGETSKKFEGISIADIDEYNHSMDNANITPLDTTTSDTKPGRAARKQTMDRITQLQSCPDNNFMMLTENYQYREVRTTQRSGSTTSTSVRVYHDYGPGKMFTFSSDNKLISTCGLDYKMTFGEYADPGTGLNFIPISNNNILLMVNNTLCRYSMDKGSQRLKKPSVAKSTKNAYTGRFNQFLKHEDHVYLFEIKNKKQISMSSFSIK